MNVRVALSISVALALAPVAGHADTTRNEKDRRGWQVRGNIYWGLGNLNGPIRRLTDGQWAGASSQDPSTLSLSWSDGTEKALMSVGVGEMYLGPNRVESQPAEFWYRRGSSDRHWTFGKHYVPFGLQEWEYETRWGGMFESLRGPTKVSVSASFEETTQAVVMMARLAREVGGNSTLGVSAAGGRGWSYGTSFSRGYGMDITTTADKLTLTGELLEGRSRQERFRFAFVRASWQATEDLCPFLAWYHVRDSGQEMEPLRSIVLAVEYDVNSTLTIEPGVGRANGRSVWWVQGRVTF